MSNCYMGSKELELLCPFTEDYICYMCLYITLRMLCQRDQQRMQSLRSICLVVRVELQNVTRSQPIKSFDV